MDKKYKYGALDENDDEQRGLLGYVKEIVRRPIDLVLSKTAQRAYLTTILIIALATIFSGFAVTAYTLFYWSYIPRIGFERAIHLQFDNVYPASDGRYDVAGNPYGIVNLSPDIVSAQRYDVSVELSLPRTPDNRDAGNFMLEASMFAQGSPMDPVKDTLVLGSADTHNRLALSRRPAILSYRSLPVEYLYRLTELHWYLLGWRNEAEKLIVSLWEGLEFARGWRNVPATMRLDIQSTHRMQVYFAKVIFKARLGGLRWLMYNHRIISAIIFITGFWTTEMVFAGLAWGALSFYVESPSKESYSGNRLENSERVKQEDQEVAKADLSETERTFPTSSKQQPLRYESPHIKQEDDEDAVVLPEASNKATEADDEDEEDADVFLDSGLGTSMESGTSRRDSLRRRRGRAKSDDSVK